MSEVKEITNRGVELGCDESLVDGRTKLPTTSYELPTNKNYETLYELVKKESIERKEQLKALAAEKSELESKLKTFEDMSKQEQEQKLKEKEDYKALLELKEQEINKYKNEFEPVSRELEELRALKTQVEQKEQTRRENLLNEIKAVSEKIKNDSYLTIAAALTDNDKLELFLKAISPAGEKKIPVYNSKLGVSPKPAGEAFNPDSLLDLQKLYKEDREKYNQIITARRGS